MKKPDQTRRKLLLGAAAAGASAATLSGCGNSEAAGGGALEADVAIVGAGLAGLACAREAPRHYVGNGAFLDGTDPEPYRPYAAPKTEFLALAPWVIADADRETLAAMGAKLAPGSRDARENDYLETAGWADLTK